MLQLFLKISDIRPVRLQNLLYSSLEGTFALQPVRFNYRECVNFKSVCFFWKGGLSGDTPPLLYVRERVTNVTDK